MAFSDNPAGAVGEPRLSLVDVHLDHEDHRAYRPLAFPDRSAWGVSRDISCPEPGGSQAYGWHF